MLVKDLATEREGDHVTLRWTTPFRTTDDMEIKGPMTAEICRETGARPLTPVARAAACAPVRRLAVTPGPSEVADTLPASLQAEPVALLTYRVQIFNSTGHSAGESAGAYAAAGAAPPTVESLRATASERGAILEWRGPTVPADGPAAGFIDLKRIDISAPSVAEKKPKSAPARAPGKGKTAPPAKPSADEPAHAHLRTADAATSGTIDATAAMGSTYTYVAERVRQVTLGTHALEIRSEPSPLVTLAMRDTFPPKSPTGLATIAGSAPAGPYLDLSWEPNGEADLAGYRVYRQLARPDGSPQGPLARLTELPLAAPAYRDVAVKAGQGYIYTVTAVDATGNESAPSAKALETIPPNTGESPH